MKLKTIVTGTDFSEASLVAVEAAFNLDLEQDGVLFLVHAVDPPAVFDPMGVGTLAWDELESDVLAKLDQVIPSNPDRKFRVEKIALRGNPIEVLARVAVEKEADMIVVGTHGKSGLERVFLGSTAEGLLRKAPCQVLVAKHKMAGVSMASE